MKTLAFYAVFGTAPGYNHNSVYSSLQTVSDIWQKAMQEEFDKSKIMVSAVLSESNTIYPVAFGCPGGGEKTVTVTGHINPNFFSLISDEYRVNYYNNVDNYRNAVIRVCKEVKKALKQTTVSIGFYEVENFVYLTDKDDPRG